MTRSRAGLSPGAQAGASTGEVALLPTTDKAVNSFKAPGKLSIGVDAQANRAFYARKGLTPQPILEGGVPHPGNNVLGLVLGV